MQDLRLVGVHDDGEHLLLSGTGGECSGCRSTRRSGWRPAGLPRASRRAAPVAMSPRDIQARIRSGSTAAEVAAACGMPLEKVERYEGPVLAERAYVAQQAQKVEVASPAPGHDVYRSAFGDNPATLGDMVAHRLYAHGIESSHPGVGLLAPAGRHLDRRRQVCSRSRRPRQHRRRTSGDVDVQPHPQIAAERQPLGPAAQRAGALGRTCARPPALRGVRQAFRLRNRRRSRGPQWHWCRRRHSPGPANSSEQQKDPDGLLDMLRSRRGQRLGVDEDSDDALALLLANGVPAAHPRPDEASETPRPAGRRQMIPIQLTVPRRMIPCSWMIRTRRSRRRTTTTTTPPRLPRPSSCWLAGVTAGPRCSPASTWCRGTRTPTTTH